MVEQDDKCPLILKTFDKLELDTIHERRMAWKPLHDYYMKIIKEAGIKFCNLDETSITMTALNTRWKNIKNCLEYIEDPKSWDQTLNTLHKIRVKVEHKDDYDPKKESLLKIREDAPKFTDWILKVSRAYYLQSKDYTFIDAFYKESRHYIRHANIILGEFGEKTPYVVHDEFDLLEDTYQQIPTLKHFLEDRIQVSKLEDIKVSDLENLIKIVEIISNFKAKEENLISSYICPKCGAKIEETQQPFGGSEDDPEPDGVYCRIGCEKCDYIIETETIYL